jgi:hypothetical protein
MPTKKYTAEVLAPIVAKSHSLSDVIRALGLKANGGNHRLILGHVRRAGIDISHFGLLRLKDRVAAIPSERLELLVGDLTSFAQVLSACELPVEGRAHRLITERVRKLGLDTAHFTGPGWSRGQTADSNASVARVREKLSFTDTQVFVANGPCMKGPSLARRLVAMGIPYHCSLCGVTEWRGRALVLHLDHINGIHNDNRLENIRLLCPNCHSQTDTYCNRARPKPSTASESRRVWYRFRRSERGEMAAAMLLGGIG